MKKYFRVVSTLTLLFAFVISQIGQITAQSNALAITPRKDYTLEAGDSVSDTLSITNRDLEVPLNLKLTITEFTAQDESGTPQLLRDNNQGTPWSAADFISMPEQVVVKPNETIRVPIRVEVPNDTGAGSYYSAIEYAAQAPTSGEQVTISASGVTLLFVNVPGQAKQQLTFEQFGAFVPDPDGISGVFKGIFLNDRPKVLAYRLKNEGNIAEQPNASIVVKNSAGKEVYTIADANPKDQIALRGQTRRFESCMVSENLSQTTEGGQEVNTIVCGDTNFTPGRYTAELSVVYGQNGAETREITARTTFWYLPWWFLGIVIIVIAIVVGIVMYAARRVKSFRSRKTRRR